MGKVPAHIMQQFVEENKKLKDQREKDLQAYLSEVSKLNDPSSSLLVPLNVP